MRASPAGNVGSTLVSSSVSTATITREISIFWDYENVPLPENCRAAEVSKCIHAAVSQYGRIVDRRLYSDSRKFNAGLTPSNRRFLDSTGFDIVDTPSKGHKETIDKKMIADILSFAWDRTMRNVMVDNATLAIQPCVVLITSDGDYAYTLSKLRDRGVLSIVLYGKQCTVAQVLVDTADVALSFEKDVLVSIKREESTHSSQVTLVTECTSKSSTSASKDTSITPETIAMLAEEDSSSGHESTFAQGKALVVDNDVIIFCNSVLSLQKAHLRKGITYNVTSIDACWVTDLQAGGYFRKLIRHTTSYSKESIKPRHQHARSQALSRGILQMGRRLIHNQSAYRQIIPVSWDFIAENNSEFSTEVYLRLTQDGKKYLSSLDSSKSLPINSALEPSAERQSLSVPSLKEVVMPLAQDDISSITHIEKHEQCQVIQSIPSNTLNFGSAPTEKCNCVNNSDEHLVLLSQFLQQAEKKDNSSSSEGNNSSCKASDSSKISELLKRYEPKVQYNDVKDLAVSSYGNKIGQSPYIFADPDEICSRLTGAHRTPENTVIYPVSPDKNAFRPIMADESQKTYVGSKSSIINTREVVSSFPNTTTTNETSSLPYDDGLFIFCKCVKTLQVNAMKNINGFDYYIYWVTDTSVSQHYRSCVSAAQQRVNNNTKLKIIDYKSARDHAILKGLVEVGRRQLVPSADSSIKNIVAVDWGQSTGKKNGLSAEVYLRLTKEGSASLSKMQPFYIQKQQEQSA
jgi:hypothetical protein